MHNVDSMLLNALDSNVILVINRFRIKMRFEVSEGTCIYRNLSSALQVHIMTNRRGEEGELV